MACNGSTSATVALNGQAKRDEPPEGGWGWVVAGGTFLITMMLSIPGITFGILLNDTLIAFDTTTATASWTMAISLGFSSFISPLVTMGISSSSCRLIAIIGGLFLASGMMLSYFAPDIDSLFLTYGLLTGIGYGCNRISTAVVLGEYFHRRYSTSTGFMMAGFSMSRLIFSSVIQLIKDTYGLRGTYLITGAICLNICVGASLFQPAKWHSIQTSSTTKDVARNNDIKIKTTSNSLNSKERVDKTDLDKDCEDATESLQLVTVNNNVVAMKQEPPMAQTKGITKKQYIDMSLLRDKSFYLIVASTIPFQVVFIYSSIFLVPLGRDKGYAPMDAAMVQTYKAIGELAGRLGIPWFLAFTECEPMSAYLTMCILNGFAFIAHSLCDGYPMFVITAILSAFLCGGIAIQGYHLTLMCVGRQRLSSALGLCALFVGVFVLAAGPLLGYVRDVTGTLVNSFLIIAALQFITGFIWLNRVLSLWRNRKGHEEFTSSNGPTMITVRLQ